MIRSEKPQIIKVTLQVCSCMRLLLALPRLPSPEAFTAIDTGHQRQQGTQMPCLEAVYLQADSSSISR
jgi:hypothetical protein